jgi:ribosomal protein S6
VNANNQAYFYSYYLKLTPSNIKDIKQVFLYNTVLLKYDIFRMTKNQTSFEFKPLQKELEDIINSWEEKKM